jgi:hypothetical protein
MSSDNSCNHPMEFSPRRSGLPGYPGYPYTDDRGATLMCIYINAAHSVTDSVKCRYRVR